MCQFTVGNIVYTLLVRGILSQCPLFPPAFLILFEPPAPEPVKIETALTHKLLRVCGARDGVTVGCCGPYNLRYGLRVHVPGVIVCPGGHRFRLVTNIIHIDDFTVPYVP